MGLVYANWPVTNHDVTSVNVSYRGYRLGFFQITRVGFVSAWRSETEVDWRRAWMYSRSEGAAVAYAKKCVDHTILCFAMERVIGRPLNQNEVPAF
jgi:hypothetical protein